MARIRTIKPDFFRHELLQDLERANPGKHPMLVFAGLFGHCDKAGHFEWKPRTLKLDILPFLDFDMAETMAVLEGAKLVRKYTVNGRDYGEIPTFNDHQRVSGKEAQEPEKHPRPKEEVKRKRKGSTREAPETAGREGKGREEEGNGVIASSAEAPSAGGLNGNAIAYIPLNDNSEFGVSKELAAELAKLYPAVDVPQTLNEIRGWNIANPGKRKTRRGVVHHINSWMAKEQNRGAKV